MEYNSIVVGEAVTLSTLSSRMIRAVGCSRVMQGFGSVKGSR